MIFPIEPAIDYPSHSTEGLGPVERLSNTFSMSLGSSVTPMSDCSTINRSVPGLLRVRRDNANLVRVGDAAPG